MNHILIVEANFYKDIGEHLVKGAIAALDRAGVTYERLGVPGALEIPGAIKMAAKTGQYDAYIALGCIIRGETYHFEVVSNESARGLMDLSINHDLVISNGILTCNTREQAMVRADSAQKNKGGSFAHAALEMIGIKQKMIGRT